MLQVVLCDDDPGVLSKYSQQIEALSRKHGIALCTRCYGNAEAMLFAIEDAPQPVDIIYMDVQMKPIDGIEAGRRLRDGGCRAQLIFLSNAPEYVFESFDCMPLQYLVKGNVSDEKFEQVFLHAVELASIQEKDLFSFERGGVWQSVSIQDIAYFEVHKRIVTLHHTGGSCDFYSSMAQLEQQLPQKGFVRAHRSFLVNVAHIRRLDSESAVLTGGQRVPLGRTYMREVRQALSRFLLGKAAQKE